MRAYQAQCADRQSCLVALRSTLISPAQAARPDDGLLPDQITAATIDDSLRVLGVSAVQRDALMRKLDDGIPWDSATGTDPQRTVLFESDGFSVTREYFADGSVTEYGIEIGVPATAAELARMISEAAPFIPSTGAATQQTSQVSPMATGIRYCTTGVSAGVFYASNCEVYYHGISWSSAFRANYQRWASGAAAQYVNASAFTIAYTLCVTSENVYSLESNTRIRYAITLAPACIGNIPFWLDLKVSPSTAYATYGP